jgi:hypothetical protein
VVLQHAFARPGTYRLTCHVDPGDASVDVLAADNAESVVVEVVERVPVLLVEGADGFAELQQDSFLVRAALGQIEEAEEETWRAVYEPRTVAPQRLESIELSDFRAVVIPNLAELSAKAVERLTQFVADGGGLWLALGPRTDIDTFNMRLFNGGDGLSPVALARIVDEASDDFEKPTINPFAKTHPATADLANNEQLDTGDVKFQRRFRFQMPLAAEQVNVLLDLSNGDPLVVENRIGRGRVLVLAVPLRHQWSNLAMSQAFVVMVHDWLAYLTEPGATRHNLLPGEPISLQVADSQSGQAVLTTPEGEDIAVSGQPLSEGMLFRSSRTASPGSYALEIGLAGEKVPFQVARDAAESDLSGLTETDRAFLAEAAGLEKGADRVRSAAAAPRAALWPGLLMLVIAVMAADLVLSGLISRKRFGTTPISETAEELAHQESLFVGITLANPARRQPAGTTIDR